MALATHRLISKSVHRLTELEIKECERCSYGGSGGMCPRLDRERRKSRSKALALMIWGADGRLIGWALLFKEGRSHGAMFYVPTKHRRQGIGTRLMRAVLRRAPKAHVYPSGKVNERFFANFREVRPTEYWSGRALAPLTC